MSGHLLLFGISMDTQIVTAFRSIAFYFNKKKKTKRKKTFKDVKGVEEKTVTLFIKKSNFADNRENGINYRLTGNQCRDV